LDIVLVGAEGAIENGGIFNKIGTYALGIVARELDKPLYVAAESYKFARLFPLNQRDLPDRAMGGGAKLRFADTTTTYSSTTSSKEGTFISLPDPLKVENPSCDYTPAKYITLLFTDLGVLTPSAVSDELIRLYQ